MKRNTLKSLLSLAAVSLLLTSGLSGCASTATQAGAASSAPAPRLVTVEDEYSIVLKSLDRSRARLSSQKAQLKTLEQHLEAAQAEERRASKR